MTKDSDPKDEIIQHVPAMRAFAISLTRDPVSADDLVQDAIVKAWDRFHQFEPGTNLRSWLFTILRHNFYSSRRKAKREVADVDGAYSKNVPQKPEHDGHLHLSEFRMAFSQLSDEQREALILVGAFGFSYEEAAGMCDVAVGTIKSRVNWGRARLVQLMQLDKTDNLELTDRSTIAVLATSSSGKKR
ncbi:MAG: RNA polymerase sigma factor [Arenibacterium sp.]